MADNKKYNVNDAINCKCDVRIVGESIESRIVSLNDAKKIADDMGMDLVEIGNNNNTPILRICHFDKFIYNQKKNEKKNHNNTSNQIKEIQLSVNIAKNDLNTKANHARKFIEQGKKVKVVLTMKGRELTRREENKRSIFEFITLLEDVSVPESMPKDEGNRTIVILKKKTNTKNKQSNNAD